MAGVVHIKKFEHGHGCSPEEAFRRGEFGANRCTQCGAPPEIRIMVFEEVAELERRAPTVMAAFKLDCYERGDGIPTIMLKSSPTADPKPHLRTTVIFACARCRKYAEIAAAHAPTNAIVEITEAPKNPLVIGYGG